MTWDLAVRIVLPIAAGVTAVLLIGWARKVRLALEGQARALVAIERHLRPPEPTPTESDPTAVLYESEWIKVPRRDGTIAATRRTVR